MSAAQAIEAYPLTWPRGFPRNERRTTDQFKTSLAGALHNVEHSIAAFSRDSGKKIEGLVISSNVTLGQQRPKDPGVAVWFQWDGIQVCIPIDRYEKVEANLQAIHHVIEARRTELRHGGLAIVRATFTGFKSLPAPGKGSAEGWRAVLGFQATEFDGLTLAIVETRYKQLRSQYHPDKCKQPDANRKFQAVQDAWDMAKQEIK